MRIGTGKKQIMRAFVLQILFCNPDIEQQDDSIEMPTIESMFFGPSPSQVLYNIEVRTMILIYIGLRGCLLMIVCVAGFVHVTNANVRSDHRKGN